MDRYLNTDNGGLPLRNDDIRFFNDSFFHTFYNMWESFTDSDNNVIVSGCIVTDTGTAWDITSGYVLVAGELLRVDAQSLTKGSFTGFYYSKNTTFNVGGDVLTKNNPTVVSTWQENRAIQVGYTGSLPVGELDGITGIRVPKKATQPDTDGGTDDASYVTPLKLDTYVDNVRKATNLEVIAGTDDTKFLTPATNFNHLDNNINSFIWGAWFPLTPAAGWSTVVDYDLGSEQYGQALQYRKSTAGHVQLNGCLRWSGVSSSKIELATLPTGFRPFLASYTGGSTALLKAIEITGLYGNLYISGENHSIVGERGKIKINTLETSGSVTTLDVSIDVIFTQDIF